MNTSLEVEYWVIDDDGDLVPPGSLLDVSPQLDPEFVEPMLEIKTTPCQSMAELRAEFRNLISTVVDAAHDQQKRLVPLSTPLHAGPESIPYRDKRGSNLQRQIVGPTFEDARVCAGTHVHFERSSVVDQLNTLTAIDPAFVLVNSSSHYRGEHLLECARPYLYRRSCYDPCPQQGQLWPYVDSVEEWEQRLEDAYECFRERALERGVDPAAFDDEFDPFDAVWTPVRLRKAMPTVEWRSPDAALPSQILRLTETVRSLVSHADAHGTVVASDEHQSAKTDDRLSLPSFDTVESVTDAAIHDGLEDPAVRSYLDDLGFTPSAHDPLANRLPASRLTERQAKQLRLEAAGQLEADLERTPARV
ncbi:glutamate-cysteine ligase family protein [Natronorubrum daqingense]|uniref:Glutamate--cysteine ligase n=1 Tax=Natronorubrum daqingense TaxID=588898 RepID=A0A1N7FSW1_9EURY|nr:glutamate-cysteine ligase family protein [Natronorubrum daqingense]APX98251.1 glutamate--cysteine ligase [Natronorubrum daqingense]SIS03367.1 Glutamate-cysteine ligase family 2(GCS2) [Natronorubrum daqingense]